MPNRDNKSCNQAVQDFWNKERESVREGKGSRDWTPEQQEVIMNYKADGSERAQAGIPKDENGRSYEGHHMKSAEEYPEHQASADNIQPLTREEHQAAHGGKFQNSTNGYYNPENGETTEFEMNEPSKPEPTNLSQSITQKQETSHDEAPVEEQAQEEDMEQEM